MPVLLACAIEDSTDIFGISGGGGVEPPNHPLGTLLYCRNIIGTIILEAHNYQEMKAGHFRRRVCYSSRVVQQTSTTFFIFIWFRAII